VGETAPGNAGVGGAGGGVGVAWGVVVWWAAVVGCGQRGSAARLNVYVDHTDRELPQVMPLLRKSLLPTDAMMPEEASPIFLAGWVEGSWQVVLPR